MNLRPHRRTSADINLTPLIDIVFLLLIFFMVSTTFKDEARLRVQLPEAQGEDIPAKEPTMIRLVIDRAGHFFVNDQAVADAKPESLARVLGEIKREGGALPVLIQADAEATHQSVMTAMDAASQAGLNRIAFAATRPDDEDP
ncbi:biopolymer transporter ExbD [Thiorhodococcus mannitoliphagus]|uniref:Biopolymer transporter ExbD n=1 Tax=Thiorhodococcus mannitoliphagus TaxID=329406 RepID=A0A6P1DWM3_9GAMM|nr:biopolymer transporter ExbD [Thiorhodococcus mannitoliphagus]NEX21533.1 biopolymer transporter ExbD [Thiorhodococcus mannitoliphagus]